MNNEAVVRKFYSKIINNEAELIFDYIHKKCNFLSYFGQKCFGKQDILVYLKAIKPSLYYGFTMLEIIGEKDLYVVKWSVSIEDKKNITVISKFIFENNQIIRIVESDLSLHRKYRYVCTLSYDGSNYSGFQKQKNAVTIQHEIEKALNLITKEEITIHSSGRTDAGVHAFNQVFHFETNSSILLSNWKRVMNSYLPNDIYVKEVKLTHKLFHSRYDVLKKEYRYIINVSEYDPLKRNYEWFTKDLNFEKMKVDVKKFIGVHDFTSFSKEKKENNIREIYEADVYMEDERIIVKFIGNGFLRHMVRIMVACLVDVSTNNLKLNDIAKIIEKRDRFYAKNIAPSCGLYLYKVTYKK